MTRSFKFSQIWGQKVKWKPLSKHIWDRHTSVELLKSRQYAGTCPMSEIVKEHILFRTCSPHFHFTKVISALKKLDLDSNWLICEPLNKNNFIKLWKQICMLIFPKYILENVILKNYFLWSRDKETYDTFFQKVDILGI